MSWREIVATVAPTIGTALGGPLGGMAANVVCEALGITPGSSDSDIEKQLLGNPEQLAKVQVAEISFKQRLAELNIDIEKIAAGDRDSARKREIAVRDATPRILATLIITGYFFVQWFLLYHTIPSEMRELILRSMGTLDMALGLVLSYYFGSSAGSDKKNDILANMTK